MRFSFQEDIYSAVRSLRRNPFSGFLVVMMLALSIGGNAMAFSWIDALLLRPLPFANSEQLVYLDEAAPKWNLESTAIHYADFESWRRSQTTFEAMAVVRGQDFNLSGLDRPEHETAALVTHDFFDVLGLRPVHGRLFDQSEDRPGGPNVLLLGHALWQNRFGGRRNVLAHQVHLDGEPYTVIGVLPPEAGFPIDAGLWIPLRADPIRWRGYSLVGLGRLQHGVDLATAEADLSAIQRHRVKAGEADEEVVPIIGPLRERFLGQARPYALAFWAVVVLVLAIVCANITCLLLVHGQIRRREFGIRQALGAGRFRLLRHILTECLLLAMLGGSLGWVFGMAGLRSLMAWIGEGIPFWAIPRLDFRVFAFCATLCLVVTVLCGIAPYLRIAARPVANLLGTAASVSLDRRGHRLLRTLVAVEVAVALTLLFATAFVVRSFFELRQVDPGFRTDKILTFRLHLPAGQYDSTSSSQFYEELRQGLETLPGVLSASAVSASPLSGPAGAYLVAENLAQPVEEISDVDSPTPVVLHRIVASDYFATMGIPVLRGRSFVGQDGRYSETPVVIINQSLAQRYWPGRDPIGQRLRYRKRKTGEPWMTVIGMARDVLHDGLDRNPRPGVYVPLTQRPTRAMTLVVRGSMDPRQLAKPIQALVADLDPGLPVFDLRTMAERLEASVLALRLVGELASLFLGLALLLALGGIYGVTSYSVSQRTREMAIRMALGARPALLRRQVLCSGARLVAVGIGMGAVTCMCITRGFEAVLYGVEGCETWILGLGAMTLAAVALLGTLLPAWRASRVEAASTLRL